MERPIPTLEQGKIEVQKCLELTELEVDKPGIDRLGGTTMRVYRYVFKAGNPVGIRDIQRALGLSSSSTAHYHVQKLLALGLVRAEGNGYVADKLFLENYIRIKRTAFPIQGSLVVFFTVTLVFLLTLARPSTLTSGYLMGILACGVALAASILSTIRDIRQSP